MIAYALAVAGMFAGLHRAPWLALWLLLLAALTQHAR
jgi:quinol-cytochrome oxidoreductase complex cytochrome b subunit